LLIYLWCHVFLAEHWGFSWRAPADCINSAIMSLKICHCPCIILFSLNNVNFPISRTSRQYQSIFPRCPCNAVNWGICFKNIDSVPYLTFYLLPDVDFSIIATSRNYTFIFGMCPTYLPDWPSMARIYLLFKVYIYAKNWALLLGFIWLSSMLQIWINPTVQISI
jgi:hypothetical protein